MVGVSSAPVAPDDLTELRPAPRRHRRSGHASRPTRRALRVARRRGCSRRWRRGQNAALPARHRPRAGVRIRRALRAELAWGGGEHRVLTVDVGPGGFAALLGATPPRTRSSACACSCRSAMRSRCRPASSARASGAAARGSPSRSASPRPPTAAGSIAASSTTRSPSSPFARRKRRAERYRRRRQRRGGVAVVALELRARASRARARTTAPGTPRKSRARCGGMVRRLGAPQAGTSWSATGTRRCTVFTPGNVRAARSRGSRPAGDCDDVPRSDASTSPAASDRDVDRARGATVSRCCTTASDPLLDLVLDATVKGFPAGAHPSRCATSRLAAGTSSGATWARRCSCSGAPRSTTTAAG